MVTVFTVIVQYPSLLVRVTLAVLLLLCSTNLHGPAVKFQV